MALRSRFVLCKITVFTIVVFICISSVTSLSCTYNSRLYNATEYNSGIPEIQENNGHSVEPCHRQKMMFPLLLNIASRLVQTVSLSLAALATTFFMGIVAKKAFILSVAAFGLMIYEVYYKKKEKKHYYIVNHREKSAHFPSDPVFGF